MSWRDDPATKKQLDLIMEMNEFSDYPLPPFTGKTKGEASDYIDKWMALSHESAENIGHYDNYGDRI